MISERWNFASTRFLRRSLSTTTTKPSTRIAMVGTLRWRTWLLHAKCGKRPTFWRSFSRTTRKVTMVRMTWISSIKWWTRILWCTMRMWCISSNATKSKCTRGITTIIWDIHRHSTRETTAITTPVSLLSLKSRTLKWLICSSNSLACRCRALIPMKKSKLLSLKAICLSLSCITLNLLACALTLTSKLIQRCWPNLPRSLVVLSNWPQSLLARSLKLTQNETSESFN